jgi:endonuclease-3 related protein
MPTLDEAFSTLHSALLARFGHAPALVLDREPFEAMCSVLLERSLGSKKGLTAFESLRESGLLAPERLANGDAIELNHAATNESLAVSASALAALTRLARWLVQNHGGQFSPICDPHRSTGWLRGELASIKGVGIAGADALLLYALKRPAYPVDRATFRVLLRHGWLDATATYDEARDRLVDCAGSATVGGRIFAQDRDVVADLTDVAHGMDQIGRHYCKLAAPLCDDCPLVALLPEGGCRQMDE